MVFVSFVYLIQFSVSIVYIITTIIVSLLKACMELDLGLDEDDWNSIATNLLKDFNKNIRNVAISSLENFVNLGDFLSEIQSLTDEKRRRQPADDNSVSCVKIVKRKSWPRVTFNIEIKMSVSPAPEWPVASGVFGIQLPKGTSTICLNNSDNCG